MKQEPLEHLPAAKPSTFSEYRVQSPPKLSQATPGTSATKPGATPGTVGCRSRVKRASNALTRHGNTLENRGKRWLRVLRVWKNAGLRFRGHLEQTAPRASKELLQLAPSSLSY